MTTNTTALDEMKTIMMALSRLDERGVPVTFDELMASQMTGTPAADALIREAWRTFITQQVNGEAVRAELPLEDNARIFGLTAIGREAIARWGKILS
ncbi:hypothetical protein [Cupriavidus sp. UME77]|uniref:hypothetical protein n=1 Tax=Cupriavidus sp. UME77 TaxID=1862321 RepID=UPI0016011CD2|nr:hypothetical protein [Cupriavidus sp. UME77]MBB1632465.1 hypothetical protein [Cupriavidus sp. UME77]